MNKSPCSSHCWSSGHAAGKRPLPRDMESSLLYSQSNPPGVCNPREAASRTSTMPQRPRQASGPRGSARPLSVASMIRPDAGSAIRDGRAVRTGTRCEGRAATAVAPGICAHGAGGLTRRPCNCRRFAQFGGRELPFLCGAATSCTAAGSGAGPGSNGGGIRRLRVPLAGRVCVTVAAGWAVLP